MKTLIYCLLVVILASACAAPAAPQAAGPISAPNDTATPATISTQTPVPTDAPSPTQTPTSRPTDTPVPTATPDLAATAEVEATQEMEATVSWIQAELAPYDITIDGGYLAFSDVQGKKITLNSYGQSLSEPFQEGLVLSNFIVKMDVTWESKTGLAVCGFRFRGEQDFDKGSNYLFATWRLSGLPAWDIAYYKNGFLSHDVSGVHISNVIDQNQGATNTYLLLAQGNTLTMYANNYQLGTSSSQQRVDGELAYFGSQESGETTCDFSNVWVWALPDGSP